MPDQETQEIQDGVIEATETVGPWEFGHYIERKDGEDWTPLIYGGMTAQQAHDHHMRQYLETGLTGPFRRSRVVRRAVSPWEIQDRVDLT